MTRTNWLIISVGLVLLALFLCVAEIKYQRIMRALAREVDR